MQKGSPDDRLLNFYSQPCDDLLEPPSRTQVKESATVLDVLERFSSRVPAVVVVDDKDRPTGILTPGDVTRLSVAYKTNKETPIRDLMTRHPAVAYAGTSVGEVLEDANRRHLESGLPVVDRITEKYMGYFSTAKVYADLKGLLRLL